MPRRKPSHYAVAIEGEGRASADGGEPTLFGREWTPEHLVLAALGRCVLTSLAHHARRDGLTVEATADTDGTVFERDDGRWGFVELECRIDVRLDPAPPGDALTDLIARAERGCFVGASLEPPPVYRWRLDGRDVA